MNGVNPKGNMYVYNMYIYTYLYIYIYVIYINIYIYNIYILTYDIANQGNSVDSKRKGQVFET